jgi:thymidylate synthase ThyX
MGLTENFTDEQKNILKNFVSNNDKNIFVLFHLPEVIKGALFSRYSRSTLGLRSLLLKEFVNNQESQFFSHSFDINSDLQSIKKAQDFYDRILDGFGDDSIGELGGAHLAVENISMLAAKAIEDCRIGGSPLEKSTRYIYFNQKVNGEYLYYREPVLLQSSFKDLYLETCNHLFDTYSQLIPLLTEKLDTKNFNETPTPAYTAALRAKVLDCLRGLLPASTLTNVGLFGNGRFYEGMLKKLFVHPLQEMKNIGNDAYQELALLIPSFIRRSHPDHKNQKDYENFSLKTKEALKQITEKYARKNLIPQKEGTYVKLVDYDNRSLHKVASALLYEYTDWSLEDLTKRVSQMSFAEIETIFDAACNHRQNRRHKSPRALEQAQFTFEMVSDFGIYRDLHRHRMLTQERQLLNCSLGYYIPDEILGTEMEKPYREAMDKAKSAYERMKEKYPQEAQYVVPMAYRLRWYFHVNLRSLQWLCELRSSKAGHPNYRRVAQQLVQEIFKVLPPFKRFFAFMDFEMTDLGRIDQEIKRVQKQASFTK